LLETADISMYGTAYIFRVETLFSFLWNFISASKCQVEVLVISL